MTLDFIAAINWLKARPESTGRFGVVGFCFGGGISNTLAVRMPDLGAAVPFYGGAPAAEDVPKIKAAVLVHHGELDTRLVAGVARVRGRTQGEQRPSRRVRLPEGEPRLPQRHDAALRRGGGEARVAADAGLVQ